MKVALIALCLAQIALPTTLAARSKRPQFKVDSLNVTLAPKYRSKYNRARLERNIRAKLFKMKRCFVALIKKNPKYDGFLWLSVTFDRRGKVTQKNLTTTVKNAIAMKCMEIMEDFWKLPRKTAGKANAQVHIVAR